MANARRTGWMLLPTLMLAVALGAPTGAIEPAPPNAIWNCCRSTDPATGSERIDASCFFDLLVNRYQRLSEYEDVADVLQTTRRVGAPTSRVHTRIGCAIVDGHLQVRTPRSSLWRLGRLGRDIKRSAAMNDAVLDYHLWLAPHMALKYAEHPKKEFRTGVDEGFTATEAEAVTIDSKPMVHLELTSGDGESGDHRARFDLYVNPESMLVEQITGHQRLEDGASYETTLTITPTTVVDVDEAGDDCLSTSPEGVYEAPEPSPVDPSPIDPAPIDPAPPVTIPATPEPEAQPVVPPMGSRPTM